MKKTRGTRTHTYKVGEGVVGRQGINDATDTHGNA